MGSEFIYNYAALDNLVHDISILNTKILKIMAHEVKYICKTPYLKYLLFKDIITDTLDFPCVNLTSTKLDREKTILLSKLNLFGILQLDNYEQFEKKSWFKGFYANENELRIFIDLTECNLIVDHKHKNNELLFCLLDEIINHEKVYHFCIDPSVTNFFIQNIDFCFLKRQDKTDDNYDLPIVAYVGIQQSKLNFTYTFGVLAKDKSAIFGPYYYFTDYDNAKKHENENDGIVRFALFLGKMKVIENLLTDEIDKSITKKERLMDKMLDHNTEVLTMRISDHDGNWTENYDSLYFGKIELDNGKYLDNMMFVIKDYHQQIPLSILFEKR
jgi:hypothetical protein